MKLVSWNVNGLRAVLQKGFDAYLADENADVVCLQEIKANEEQVVWTPPQGYQAFWNSAEKKGYAGTMILTKHSPLSYRVGIGEPMGDVEGRVQTIEFNEFYLVNVYTPNAKGDLSRLAFRTQIWDKAFRDHCSRLAAKKGVLFCGDLNVAHQEIDLANPKANRLNAGFTEEERQAFDDHLRAGFVDTFRQFNQNPAEYSWWSYRGGARSRNVGWRIDYFCASLSMRDRLKHAFIRQEIMGSDHCPVGLELKS